ADEARMVLPDGSGLLWASVKLQTSLKERIPMIAFLMDVIRLSVKKDFTIYLLGSKTEYLERVFMNLQKSFPGVRIIGRQSGYFNPSRESLIKESLRKSAPDLIFLGMGFPLQEKWIRENKEHLSRAVVIGVDGAFDVLSGKNKKGPDWAQTKGLIWFWRTISRPWLLFRFMRMISFYIIVLFKSVFSSNKKESE
ncbi:MAG: WecB/TagA/CpsF family glycosyltransferase, partial [Spirochaetia bacterium]|nr:WecB/TagA/CpsF family glycosyltransferase [Spirochaetia bacterium]